METILLEEQKYKIHDNYKDGFDLEILKERFTEYFLPFDYVLGDWSYGKVRLKGFYDSQNKKCSEINNVKDYKTYLEKHCANDCRYFIIKKVIE